MKSYNEIFAQIKAELALKHNIITQDDDPALIFAYMYSKILYDEITSINLNYSNKLEEKIKELNTANIKIKEINIYFIATLCCVFLIIGMILGKFLL